LAGRGPKVTNQQAIVPCGKGAACDWRVSFGCVNSF
jgi:hypothetical protein